MKEKFRIRQRRGTVGMNVPVDDGDLHPGFVVYDPPGLAHGAIGLIVVESGHVRLAADSAIRRRGRAALPQERLVECGANCR